MNSTPRGFVSQQPPSPAGDPLAPYVRVAVVGLIHRVPAHDPGGAAAAWLLLHRTKPFDAWDPPGGRMEPGEDLVAAVRREVLEETGMSIEVAGPCFAYLTFYSGERLLAVSMACRPASGPDDLRLEPDGATDWRWTTGHEWETLAEAGLSSWDPRDVRKATRAVAALWEAERS